MQILSFYIAVLLLGIGFLPMTSRLFRSFSDRGWLFSKALGLFLAGWVFWVLNTSRVLVFSQQNVLIVCVCLFAANAALLIFLRKRETGPGSVRPDVRKIVAEEILFLLVFLIFLRLVGFRPEAYDTEKFMDFGFLTSIRRSAYMPFSDLWFAGKPVNYYYGGQYFSAFLIRLAGVTDGCGYNLMRALITSVTFCFPFSIVSELLRARLQRESAPETRAADGRTGSSAKRSAVWSIAGGALAGLAVAFCGNGHYLIYGILGPLAARIRGSAPAESYWFPDSTRFIGYVPEGNDKTIHEFPSYSSILGDLHAHYINLIFVLLLIAILCAWVLSARRTERADRSASARLAGEGASAPQGGARSRVTELLQRLLLGLADGRFLLIALLTGIFRWTNFWDFPIYLVVTGAVMLFVNLKTAGRGGRGFAVLKTAVALCAAVLIGKAAVLPFTGSFEMISSEIAKTFSHSPVWQFLILWAAPVLAFAGFFALLLFEFRRRERNRAAASGEEAGSGNGSPGGPFFRLLHSVDRTDLTVLIFGAAAVGLIFLPELVYVRDIYEESHARANTMFKLTYQAYVLFALMMSYAAVRFLKKRRVFRICGIALGAFLVLTGGYFVKGSADWFGVKGIGAFFGAGSSGQDWKGIDAMVFLTDRYPEDVGAVGYLLANAVPGRPAKDFSELPVVLEADGESYGASGRVSVATGLPTVLGWHTHEWLWRGDWGECAERSGDVKEVYTSGDAAEIARIVEKYRISYIYIGGVERDRFPDLDEQALRALYPVSYEDETGTCVLITDVRGKT